MADFFEETIKNFSGLSSETKPTIAAGNAVPNGSRWREVDTEKVFYFNVSDDTWYPQGINTTVVNGVPNTYIKQSEDSDIYNIVKGNLNKLRIRPRVQNEHVESSREAMDVIDSSTDVGQIFKASQGNINGITLTLESAAIFASMDAVTTGAGEHKAGTMEYSSDAALQAEYIKGGAVEAVRSAFTDDIGVTQDGSFACKMPMDTNSDEWRVTLTSTDLTGVTFKIKYANTKEFNKAKMAFFIGDGTNTKSFQLAISDKNIWQTFPILESAMAVTGQDDTGATPSMPAITKMGFRVDDKDGNEFAYADSITYQAEPGSFDVELWDMGTSLPANNGTVDYTTGTQYTELGDRGILGGVASSIRVTLQGGKRQYHINNFVAGVALEVPANTLLNSGNYYALVLKYVDTDVTIFGPDTTFSTNYYSSGYAWKAETGDNLIDVIPGAAGSGAFSDLMFQIFSTQDIYIVNLELLFDAAPGTGMHVSFLVEDDNMLITDVIDSAALGGFDKVLIYDTSLRPVFMVKGGKLEAYYDDDPTDSVGVALFELTYLFIPPTVNG